MVPDWVEEEASPAGLKRRNLDRGPVAGQEGRLPTLGSPLTSHAGLSGDRPKSAWEL